MVIVAQLLYGDQQRSRARLPVLDGDCFTWELIG